MDQAWEKKWDRLQNKAARLEEFNIQEFAENIKLIDDDDVVTGILTIREIANMSESINALVILNKMNKDRFIHMQNIIEDLRNDNIRFAMSVHDTIHLLRILSIIGFGAGIFWGMAIKILF